VARYAEPMARLIEELKKLPGVGSKTAQRFAFYILRPPTKMLPPREAVRDLKASLRLCSVCNNITDVDPCAYCASPTRNLRLVCVVEEPTNIDAIERTRYQASTRPPRNAVSPACVGPDQLRTRNLIARSSAPKSTKSSSPPAPPSKAKPPPPARSCAPQLFGQDHPHRHRRPRRSDIDYADEVTMTAPSKAARCVANPTFKGPLKHRTFIGG